MHNRVEVFGCPVCTQRYVVSRPETDDKDAAPAREDRDTTCPCGGSLVPLLLSPGVYVLSAIGQAPRDSEVELEQREAAEPQPADLGYDRSHGYPPGHGGPTGPGDAPSPLAPTSPRRAKIRRGRARVRVRD